jgi:hypothetical protein
MGKIHRRGWQGGSEAGQQKKREEARHGKDTQVRGKLWEWEGEI